MIAHVLHSSFERYIRICYYCQLRSTSLLTEENIKFYKLFVLLFPIIFYVPKFFEIRSENISEADRVVNCRYMMEHTRILRDNSTRTLDQRLTLKQVYSSAMLGQIQLLGQRCLEYNAKKHAEHARRQHLGSEDLPNNVEEKSKARWSVIQNLVKERLAKEKPVKTRRRRNKRAALHTSPMVYNLSISFPTKYTIEANPIRKNLLYYRVYYVFLNTLFASVLPLVLLLFLNIKTAQVLFEMGQRMDQSPIVGHPVHIIRKASDVRATGGSPCPTVILRNQEDPDRRLSNGAQAMNRSPIEDIARFGSATKGVEMGNNVVDYGNSVSMNGRPPVRKKISVTIEETNEDPKEKGDETDREEDIDQEVAGLLNCVLPQKQNQQQSHDRDRLSPADSILSCRQSKEIQTLSPGISKSRSLRSANKRKPLFSSFSVDSPHPMSVAANPTSTAVPGASPEAPGSRRISLAALSTGSRSLRASLSEAWQRHGSILRGRTSSRRGTTNSVLDHINKSKERRLAYVSLYIAWLFIFCHVWKLIPTSYEVLMSKDDVGMIVDWPPWLDIMEAISHTLITLNSSMNFLIYVVV